MCYGLCSAYIIGKMFSVGKAKIQRTLCSWVESFDIGRYDSYIRGCRYCYANGDLERAKQGFGNHNLNASVITGNLFGDKHITVLISE